MSYLKEILKSEIVIMLAFFIITVSVYYLIGFRK